MKHRRHSTFAHHRFLSPSDLNSEEREWFSTAIALAAYSNNMISEGQMVWIESALHFMDKPERDSYIHMLKTKNLPKPQPLRNIDRAKAAKIFLDLVLTIIEDFEIDEKEFKFLINIASTLGIKVKRGEDVINWANEFIRLFNEKDRFVERITRDDAEYLD